MNASLEKGDICIVYAADDSFAEILGVSLMSLYESNGETEELSVYVLDGGMTQDNRERLEEIPARYAQAPILWRRSVDVMERMELEVHADRGSPVQYARLFLEEVLPQELGRVLYLDADTLICGPIRELWNLELQGRTVGALMDAFSRNYRRDMGLDPEDLIFNSGVMLIDLNQWRERSVEQKMREFIRSRSGYIPQGDQGVLNAVLSRDCLRIDPQYNAVTIFYDFSYKEMLTYRRPAEDSPSASGFYSEAQILRAAQRPVIVHFTTSFRSSRPWSAGCTHPYADSWRACHDRGPWRDHPLREDARPIWKRWLGVLYQRLPEKAAIRIAGALQVWVRPAMSGIQRRWWRFRNLIRSRSCITPGAGTSAEKFSGAEGAGTGFSGAETGTADCSSGEVMTAGFSGAEVVTAGFPGTETVAAGLSGAETAAVGFSGKGAVDTGLLATEIPADKVPTAVCRERSISPEEVSSAQRREAA